MPAPVKTKTVRGATLHCDPEREECFTVVQLHKDLWDYDDMSDISQRQRLHRHMHNEMQTLEIVAAALADFPDAPWELRMQLARQCWDESRHSAILYRRLCDMGGRKGEFPVMNYEWGVTKLLNSLPARLAVQNRTFEGGEMDLLRQQVNLWSTAGDYETAALMDALLADEVQHVRFANRWLKQMARENSRTLLQVASGIQLLKQITEALAPEPGEVNAVGVNLTEFTHVEVLTNVDDRKLAEFTEGELAELLRKEGFSSLVQSTESP
ncbi:MAG TPA: DUF455 family protein [Candidatus Dormibacteraeota bacterium]|nr:DUF455 family protein [Candidatus Dormibacteraeota bacterium]